MQTNLASSYLYKQIWLAAICTSKSGWQLFAQTNLASSYLYKQIRWGGTLRSLFSLQKRQTMIP